MTDRDSLPSGTEAALGVLDERVRRQRAEIDGLSGDLYGNGKPGIKSMVQRHDEWIERQTEADRERRRDRRALFVTVAGGAFLQLILWLIVLARIGVQHMPKP